MREKNKMSSWCSKKGLATDEPLNWASGQPAVDGCLALTLSNSSVNESTFALSDCSVEQYFVCEVFPISGFSRCDRTSCLQKTVAISEAGQVQEECKDMYDITSGMNSIPYN
jgi:hypothetical protein